MRVVGVLALVAAVVLATDAYRVVQSGRARPVTLGTALSRFRAEEQVSPAAPAYVPGTTAGAPAGTTPMPTASPATAAATTIGRPATSVSPTTGSTAAPAIGTAGPFTPPPAGVYSYRTSGGEQLNVLGSARSYPSTTYATVTHGHGCEWNIENDVIQQHTDHRDVCGIAGLLTQIDQGRSVSFFGETEGFTYVCAPPLVMGRSGLVPGATFTTPCGDGHGNNAVCHETYLGPEQVQVGGVTEPALHAVIDGVLTGVATGTTHDDLVLDASTGMILSWIRSVSTDASAAFGVKAHYSEHASFTLLNLVPQT